VFPHKRISSIVPRPLTAVIALEDPYRPVRGWIHEAANHPNGRQPLLADRLSRDIVQRYHLLLAHVDFRNHRRHRIGGAFGVYPGNYPL
jgi:hypothetical protein